MFHPQGPSFWELAQQALTSTERGYDLLAPKFDWTPFRTPDPVLQHTHELLKERGSYRDGIDLCCGTGAALRWLLPLCSERALGVDTSQGMLTMAKRNLSDHPNVDRMALQRCNVLSMPFEQDFDLAVCFGAFGHILPADEPRFVQQVFRALRPGGKFVFVTMDHPSWLTKTRWMSEGFNAAMKLRNLLISPDFIMYYLTFTLPKVQTLLLDHGFQLRVERRLFPKPYEPLVLVTATRPIPRPMGTQ
jgi:SAM-dependent methyltransferase